MPLPIEVPTDPMPVIASGRERSALLGPILVGVIAMVLRLAGGAWPIDDAFITFRYAANLANGHGLLYNIDQWVLGTSTPLFALVLALFAKLSGAAIPQVAVAVSAVADGLGSFLLFRLAYRLRLPLGFSILCSLSWAFSPLSLKYALGGMETSMVTALLIAAFSAFLSGRESLAMAFAGASVLTRPDTLAAALIIALAVLFKHKRRRWRPIGVFLLVVGPWLVLATGVYGSPLPQSVRAKSQSIYRVDPLENSRQIAYHLGGQVLNSPTGTAARGLTLSVPTETAASLSAMAVLLMGVWGLGVASALRRQREWIAFFAFPVAVAAVYALLGLQGRLLAEWYLVPLTPFYLLGIFSGLSAVVDRVRGGWASWLPAFLGALLTLAQMAGLNWGRDPLKPVWVPLAVWTERESQYQQAVQFLRPYLRESDVVAASEVGTVGYFCACRILDTVGLVSPEAVSYYPLAPEQYASNYAVPPNLIRDLRPDYLITLDVFVRQSLLKEAWFTRDFRLVWDLDSSVFGSSELLVFARNRVASAS